MADELILSQQDQLQIRTRKALLTQTGTRNSSGLCLKAQ